MGIEGEGMEFKILLEHAIDKIQNLQEYYETQILDIEARLESEKEKYKYGVLLEKYFFCKSMDIDVELTEEEQSVINEIIETCDVEKRDDGVVVRYKLKESADLDEKYELDPRIATNEYFKLSEQPRIHSESTLMMLLIRYEEAISGIFKYILLKYPEAYLKEKTITYSELMAIDTEIKEVKKRFIEKESEDFMRLPIGDWYNTFEQKHKVNFKFENKEFEKFKEVYYRRNLIVHNQGKVNDIYLKNIDQSLCGSVSRGQILDVDKKYVENAFEYTQIILYGTFWALRKLSNDKEELEERMFDKGFVHMLNAEWRLSEYIYSLMMNEKEQSDANKFCNKVNYWISVKNQGRFEDVEEEIRSFDVSAMCGQFKVAKYALLDEYEKVSEILEDIIGTEIPACYVEQWPLFLQYRESEQYIQFRDKHLEEFEKLGYQPEYLAVDSDEDIVEEFGDCMEKIE